MTGHWWQRLGNDELSARLEQRGMAEPAVRILVNGRDVPHHADRIYELLGDE